MAESMLRLDDTQLEQALRDLGRHLEFPPTPDVSLVVRRRLVEQAGRRPRPVWWQRLLPVQRAAIVVALVVLGVVAALLIAISPEFRTAVADRLGLRGVEIQQVPPLPTPVPTPSQLPAASPSPIAPTPTALALGTRLSLGTLSTLDDARAQVEYAVLVPADLGPPDQVYVRESLPGRQVTLVYLPRHALPADQQTGVGALLAEFRGSLMAPVQSGKGIPPGTNLEELTVNSGRGYWVAGAPHTFFFTDAQGRVQGETTRLAGNVLLWEQGDLTLRLEAALSRDDALRIAASLR